MDEISDCIAKLQVADADDSSSNNEDHAQSPNALNEESNQHFEEDSGINDGEYTANAIAAAFVAFGVRPIEHLVLQVKRCEQIIILIRV
jgi:hypothetical protein